MTISVWHRHLGIHSRLKEAVIEGNLKDYYQSDNSNCCSTINEELLLKRIPEGFLLAKPQNMLLAIQDLNADGNVSGSTGQIGLKIFKNWSKYFDCYSLELGRK